MADKRIGPALREVPSARLVGCMSRRMDRAEAFRAKFGALRAFDSIDRFLGDDAIRAVYIGTPSARHHEHALRCIEAGKHVLVDKPLATNGDDAASLVRAASDRGVKLGVLHQQRFHPAVRRLLSLAESGRLGRLLVVRIQIAMWLRLAKNWRFTPSESGGGVLMDLGPHAFDLLHVLLGRPSSVMARTANLALDADVEDFCAATLQFDSGAMGLVELNYSGHGYGGRIEVFGNHGTFCCDGCLQQAPEYTIHTRFGDEVQPAETHTYDGSCFRLAFEDFGRAVFDDSSPTIPGEQGVEVIQSIDRVYAAARCGRPLRIGSSKSSE